MAQSVTPLQSFIIAQDQAYFKTVFFSGDRPDDLGQVKVAEILRFPNDDGMAIKMFLELQGTYNQSLAVLEVLNTMSMLLGEGTLTLPYHL